jgi:hypothetical protein
MFGNPLIYDATVDPETGQVIPVVMIVADNGGPFRSPNFELFIMRQPELNQVRTKVRTPGQNGSRERGFRMNRPRFFAASMRGATRGFGSRSGRPRTGRG